MTSLDPTLTGADDLAVAVARTASPAHLAVALDFDGVLAPWGTTRWASP
ncbi:hypothetical protein [Litorihabitans aurantiacus]|nr:hypothetical protein [Litorihabitans aurantiacus]